jgi:hypothetical protein
VTEEGQLWARGKLSGLVGKATPRRGRSVDSIGRASGPSHVVVESPEGVPESQGVKRRPEARLASQTTPFFAGGSVVARQVDRPRRMISGTLSHLWHFNRLDREALPTSEELGGGSMGALPHRPRGASEETPSRPGEAFCNSLPGPG